MNDVNSDDQEIFAIEIWDNSTPVGRGDLPVDQIAAIETDPKQHEEDPIKNTHVITLDGRFILANRPADSCVGAFNASGMPVIPAINTMGVDLSHYWLNAQATTIKGQSTDGTPVLSVKGLGGYSFYATTDDHDGLITKEEIDALNIPVSSVE